MNKGIQGKNIVITGASGRLGRLMVSSFARKGARIAAVVRTPEAADKLDFPEDAEGWAFPFDVTDETQVVAGFEGIKSSLGGIDVLIHTVGTWAAHPFCELSMDTWNQILAVNLHATFLCFREALRSMSASYGRLIAFTSKQGVEKGVAQQAAYSVAKAGVVRLVESVAQELAGTHITVHAIAPSYILYPGMEAEKGVRAEALIHLCEYLMGEDGKAHHGSVLPAYGSLL